MTEVISSNGDKSKIDGDGLLTIRKDVKTKMTKQVKFYMLTANSPSRSSLEAFARGVLVPGSIFCDSLIINIDRQLEFIL